MDSRTARVRKIVFFLFLTAISHAQIVTVDAIRKQLATVHETESTGPLVDVGGVVASEPVIVSNGGSFVYLQDATGGIRLFTKDSLLSGIHEGDLVEAQGQAAIWDGSSEIYLKKIRKLGSTKLPRITSISAADLNTGQYSGMLVQLSGQLVVKNSQGQSRAFEIKDNSGRASVYFPFRFLLDSSFIERLLDGGNVRIVGIAERSCRVRSSCQLSDEVTPRERGDITFSLGPTWRQLVVALVTFALLVVVTLLWIQRSRAKLELRRAKHLDQLRERMRHSERMEAVGRLAGGIAHDFNNLLTVIIGYSELVLEQPANDSQLRHRIEEIKAAGTRASALTQQLLAFSRKQVLEPRIVELNAVVMEMKSMLLRLLGEDIDLDTKLSADVVRVKADPAQLEQVIMNLAINARDAMPKGGKLLIETLSVDVSDDDLDMQCGRYAALLVSDTGHGMDSATQSRIFEPFFTTKEKDKGTGLGLSTVYGIVKQSQGHVWVYSKPGMGTTFKIYLPEEVGSPAGGPSGSISRMQRRTETVLLVEDADSIRKLTSQLLKSMGCKVLEAHNGETALEIVNEYSDAIDLLITDVVMPGLSGRELAEQLSAERRDIRVLYMSGYTEDVILKHSVLDCSVAFLQKPFTREALARKLADIFPASENTLIS